MGDPGVIYAAQKWPTNAHMIKDVARLGYLHRDAFTLDATYGLGNFWTQWRPTRLITVDRYTLADVKADLRYMPFRPGSFDVVVNDPPYKLNGTPSATDKAYGVHVPTRWQDRMSLIRASVHACAYLVKPKGYLLVKCQDQVVSGRMVWQTDVVTYAAGQMGMKKIDRLDFLTDPRPQPHTRQLHARRNYSSLLIFAK